MAQLRTLHRAVRHPLALTPAAPQRNLVHLYLANLAPAGRQGARSVLRIAARHLTDGACDWNTLDFSQLRAEHILALRGWLVGSGYSLWTKNSVLARVRAICHLAWRLGYLTADEWQRIADVPGISGHPLPAGRILSQDELEALFRVAFKDQSVRGLRNAALLTVLYTTGIRRRELVGLDRDDYDTVTGALQVRRAKGGRQRRVWVGDPCARGVVGRWLAAYTLEHGPLFPSLTKWGTARGRLAYSAPPEILGELGRAAAIRPFTCHDLRRTCITRLAEAASLDIAAAIAGHVKLDTTRAYVRRPEEAQRAAAALLTIPFRAMGHTAGN